MRHISTVLAGLVFAIMLLAAAVVMFLGPIN